jgi:hypothetical protein
MLFFKSVKVTNCGRLRMIEIVEEERELHRRIEDMVTLKVGHRASRSLANNFCPQIQF